MPIVNYQEAGGAVHTAEARDGQSVMEAARQAGIGGIVAICGGSMMCGTCHVVVSPTSRLSCQIKISPALDGLLVRLPRYQPGV